MSLLSQAEALWESKSQIAGLACQDIRYKGPVYQTVRQNNNNNQSTHKFRTNERLPSRATHYSGEENGVRQMVISVTQKAELNA